MHYEFKELTDLDAAEKIYEIYKHCMYLPTIEKFRKKMDGFLRDDGCNIFTCARNGELCGVMVLTLLSPGNGEIVGIAVDPGMRGKGIGTDMIARAIAQCDLRTLVAETDGDAVGFYGKLGFSIAAFTQTYDGETVVRYNCKYTK